MVASGYISETSSGCSLELHTALRNLCSKSFQAIRGTVSNFLTKIIQWDGWSGTFKCILSVFSGKFFEKNFLLYSSKSKIRCRLSNVKYVVDVNIWTLPWNPFMWMDIDADCPQTFPSVWLSWETNRCVQDVENVPSRQRLDRNVKVITVYNIVRSAR